MQRAERVEAGGADLFAHVDEDAGIEAEATAGLQDGRDGGDVDRVLALVVGGAAAIDVVAVDVELPRALALAPLLVLAAHHVAMAVGEDGRQVFALAPFRDEEGRAAGDGVLQHLPAIAELVQGRADLLGEILVEDRPAVRVLAFRRNGDPPGEVAMKGAGVEMAFDFLDDGGAGHGKGLAGWTNLGTR